MTINILTGSKQQIEKYLKICISPHDWCGCHSVSDLPDPSEIVGDTFGSNPIVWQAMMDIDQDTCTVRAFYLAALATRLGGVTVFCEGGWHRSVALGEKIKTLLETEGYKVEIKHLGATE